MGTYTRQLEFTAYRFDPKQLRGLDDYDIEDIIIAALEIPNGIKSAFVTDVGRLDVVIYTYGKENSKEAFELNPGEWLTKEAGNFTVLTDEAFQKLATPIR